MEIQGSMLYNGEELLTEAANKNQMGLMILATRVGVEQFRFDYPAGIVFWSGMRRVPTIKPGGAAVLVLWRRHDGRDYLSQTWN